MLKNKKTLDFLGSMMYNKYVIKRKREQTQMNKIDKRHKYGIMLDTETANTLNNNGKLDMSCVLPYDFGFAIIDSFGRVYETFSFVNSDIFHHEKELMETAYYAKKIPLYEMGLANGTRQLANTYEIRKTLIEKFNEYDCKFVCAHNARFDYNACNNILRWTTKSKYRWFFPYGTEIWDTMKMARDVIAPMPTYKRFCEENNYLTKTGRVRLTAEILYRFISHDMSFVEEHTGLEDVLIETQILAYCKRQHKKMRKKLYEN